MKLYNKPEKKAARKYLRNNSTKPEQLLWDYLKNKKYNGVKFRRQYSVDRYILDFYSIELRLGIELDGEIHEDENAVDYDSKRTEYLKLRKIKVIRFNNKEIYNNISEVLKVIKQEIENCSKLPPPAPSL
ncbi:MAG: DUF559 domain-containing protein [Ignavibacteria bacterium]|nr:DUF559 domain-containing protein [Ignavibacteria bacterium]